MRGILGDAWSQMFGMYSNNLGVSLNKTVDFHLLGVQYTPLPAGGYNSFHMLFPVLVRRCLTLFT